jgi:hypothetical protein
MNIKIKYEPKSRSLKMPLIFVILSVILAGTITYALDYYPEYMSIFWIQ